MKQEKLIQILSILNDLPPVERIEVAERACKRLRQANSIETAKDVQRFITRGQRIRKENEG